MGAILAILMAVAVVVGALNGRVGALPNAALDGARDAAAFALGLVGVLALWSGLLKVAEEAGVVGFVARAARPLLRRLFPEVPDEHPALGSIVMNFSANLLGLGNAATPFGVKAMQELETLNPRPGTATNAQAMLVALNTASVQLVPIGVLGARIVAGSHVPEEIVVPTLLASLCGVVVAVTAARLLQRVVPVRDGG